MIAIVGTIAGVLAVGLAALQLVPYLEERRNDQRLRAFELARSALVDQYSDIVDEALKEHQLFRHGTLPVLSSNGWLLDAPIPLHQVVLRFQSLPPGSANYWTLSSKLLPRDGQGNKINSYSKAIGLYDRPALFFDSDSYRLLSVGTDPDSGAPVLDFTRGTYFESLDTLLALGYGAARRFVEKKRLQGAYDQCKGGPFNLHNRSAAAAIDTLTIVKRSDGPWFYIHWRDPALVASAGNTYHITPCGEFEPAARGPEATRDDFSLWHNIMREYAEEFMGYDDFVQAGGAQISYAVDRPFAALSVGYQQEHVRAYYLGTVCDPLNWKPEILTVAVFEEAFFDSTFVVTHEDSEGKKISKLIGDRYYGQRFDQPTIDAFANDDKTTPVCTSLLEMAWSYRADLLQAD